MASRRVGAILLSSVVLAGCTALQGTSQEPPELDRAHALWLDRTAYVGDGSKVTELIDETGFAAMGRMTVALQTDATPYGVKVSYSAIEKPFDTVDFTSQATLLLGLIGNLDRVDVTSYGSSFTLMRADATRQLGYDVKT